MAPRAAFRRCRTALCRSRRRPPTRRRGVDLASPRPRIRCKVSGDVSAFESWSAVHARRSSSSYCAPCSSLARLLHLGRAATPHSWWAGATGAVRSERWRDTERRPYDGGSRWPRCPGTARSAAPGRAGPAVEDPAAGSTIPCPPADTRRKGSAQVEVVRAVASDDPLGPRDPRAVHGDAEVADVGDLVGVRDVRGDEPRPLADRGPAAAAPSEVGRPSRSTCAPAACRARAVALPRPEAPPVTSAT
jgi:hypothetical protein